MTLEHKIDEHSDIVDHKSSISLILMIFMITSLILTLNYPIFFILAIIFTVIIFFEEREFTQEYEILITLLDEKKETIDLEIKAQEEKLKKQKKVLEKKIDQLFNP